jgi:two-component system CheB/CheR fusion protein
MSDQGSASPPGNKRGKRGKARSATGSGDEKDTRIRELEARVAELESGGEKGRAQTGAVITEARPAEETLRESEQPLKVLLDVSERRVAELEAVVEVQRRELGDSKQRLEASLRAAELQLAEADQRKNEFLAALAHELKTPLAPIKNSLYVLGHAISGNDPARRAQLAIERQVEQLARLASDLLDVTRLARNKIKLQCQRLELNGLVRDTVEDHRSLFDKAGVHLEFHPAPRPVLVNADWNRMAQVMGNLLQNAAKFTGRGGATLVTVHTEKAEKRAVVQVVDTGVGMTPEMVARLFQPFSQADSALDRSKGGLGLGLALVKGLVDLHGGDVSVNSPGPGHGTEFTVQLPLAMEEATVAQAGSERAAKIRRRVLVIEDDIDAADSLRDVFALGEHEAEVAYNGPEGIAKAREFRPEVVLCDIGLAGMDGFEVAQAFKADESLKDILLVALSDYALPEDLLRVSQAGFAHHMAKPSSLEKLEEILAGLPAPGSPMRRD